MLMSGFFSPAAVNTSMMPSSAVMAVETNWRTAWSSSCGDLLAAGVLASCALMAWKKAMSSRNSTASSVAAHRAKARDRSVDDLHETRLAVLLLEDVLLSGGDQAQALGGRARRPLVPVEAVQDVAGDLVLFLHDRHRLRGVDAGAALPAALGVRGQGVLELVGQAQVIHHQPAGLVAEDAVDAGDGLHQPVALHRLVGVHGVQARRVEAGQPHVAHDDDAERVLAGP